MDNTAAESSAQNAEKSKVGYQFTAIPTQLMYLCDVNVRSALFGLIQISSEFADADGWVFRTNEDLQNDFKLSQHLVVATVDTLYRKGIVSVRPQGKRGKGKRTPPNYYKLNYDKFKEYESMDFNSLRNPDLTIETVRYKEKGYKAQYVIDAEIGEMQTYSNTSTQSYHQPSEKVPTNIDNIETTNNEYEYIGEGNIEVSEGVSDNTIMAEIYADELRGLQEVFNAPIDDYSDCDYTSIGTHSDKANKIHLLTEYEQRGQQFKERNKAISRLFTQIEADIRLFKESKTDWITADHARRIEKAIRWGYEHKDYFTQKQWGFFASKEKAFRKLSEHKEAYFTRGRKGKPMPQTESAIMEAAPTTENINHTPPTPILGTDSNSEIITTEELMKAFDNLGEGKDTNQHTYYNLNETNLRTESMSDKERDYFRAEEERLSDDGVLNRYIFAHRWLRNPKDADRLFETYQERASEIANGDCALFEAYINRWNKHCEQAA